MLKLVKRIKRYVYGRYWEYEIKHASNRQLKRAIVFESIPDLTDNTKAVFDECIKRGLNERYKMIWFIHDTHKSYPKIKNVMYITPWSLEGQYYEKLAKAKICCNHFLKKETEDQFCFYLSHGTAIKDVSGFYTVPEGIDYVLVASENVADLQSDVFLFPREKAVALGFPRNDNLHGKMVDIVKSLKTDCERIIVWYPTYRQHKNGKKTGSEHTFPIIHSSAQAKKLNECAAKTNTLIVIKPHFAQDIRYIQDMKLSNICFISDAFFDENKMNSYEFVGACDALITDYSSVYFDYTLCNKPIAAVWEDIEDYKENPGLVENYEFLMKGAEKVYDLDDLCGFVQRVAIGIDLLEAERAEIRDYANISTDFCNSERVVDFIVNKLLQ